MKKIVLAALLLSSSVGAAVVMSQPSISVRPVTISRPVSVQPSKPVYVAPKANTSPSNTAMLAATTAAVVIATTAANQANAQTVPVANQANAQTVPVADADADTRLALVNVPLLTLCTEDQFVQATKWQQYCMAANTGAIRNHCVALSYQRYCDPATVDDIKGKQPARSHYINTYMR